MGEIISGIVFASIMVLLLARDQVFMFLALREVRKMAATLPEKDREKWINAALASLDSSK